MVEMHIHLVLSSSAGEHSFPVQMGPADVFWELVVQSGSKQIHLGRA